MHVMHGVTRVFLGTTRIIVCYTEIERSFFSKYVFLSFLRKMPAVFKDGEKKYIVLCKFLSSLFFMYKLFIWSLLLEQKCFENVPSR